MKNERNEGERKTMNAESEREDKAPRLAICLKKAIKLLLIYSSNTLVVAQSLAQSRYVEYAHVLPTNTDTDTATCAAKRVSTPGSSGAARAGSRDKKGAAFMRPAIC